MWLPKQYKGFLDLCTYHKRSNSNTVHPLEFAVYENKNTII